jgi:hypothetical protein
MLARAVAELTAQLAEEAEAIGRAASPDRPRRSANPRRRGRRGDTFLRVVKAAVIAAVSLGVIFAMLAPRHLKEQRYTPRSTVQVAHVHNDHDADDLR